MHRGIHLIKIYFAVILYILGNACYIFNSSNKFFLQVKLGCTGVYIIWFIFALNMNCWYSLELSPRLPKAILTCTHDLCFEQK